QSKIVELWEASSNPNEGYIATDCRNFIYPFLLNQLGYNAQVVSKFGGNGYIIRISAIQAGAGMRKDVAEFSYKGLQFISGGSYAGSWMNKFSTDTTFAGNDDHTAVSEKAIKTYVDSLIPKHFITSGKISMSGNNVVVEPRTLWLENVILSESADISKDVTVSGNYIGTDMSATEGYVYVYLKNDGSGGYDVVLSGDAPNRSDCSAGATAGKLIYRDFSSTWYTCIGVRYKSTTALKSFYVSDDGLVMFENFIEIVDAGTGSIDADYDSKLPSVINLGIFSVEMTTVAGDAPRCKIRPKGSAGSYLYVSTTPTVSATGGGQILCHAGTDNKIRVVIDKGTGSTAKVYLAGYKDIR
ncbi:hypothetical protein J7L67_05405, partial [bacterium]|nr:hypothetical protein [bacterium]